ncbi:T9SS type A sorting domain-containing protein [Pontibacter locisalis]|uniref:T9SS type A sorting domain-containing protein n=2 Tax=Pontibacter locisalis TaxID=1719035 RepID=A0ABW5IRN8_9BACT
MPSLVFGEGSKQLTPHITTNGTTDKANTTVGYLQHDDNGNQTISYGFLKPNTWSYNGAEFIEDYRMYVRLKPNETVYYGVRRRITNETSTNQASANQNDLILTLKYGTGVGTTVQTTTLLRDQSSVNQSKLLENIPTGQGNKTAPQNGVIKTAAEVMNGPNYGGRTDGYNALSYTNTTGAMQDFYLEFTQVGEESMHPKQKKSWYDLWDLTVIDPNGKEMPGRLFSKQWSFTAGASANVLSSTFAFYPLIPNQLDGTTYYVKKITLAGMRPFGFRFVTNQYGSTSQYGTTFQERRKSQLVQSDYSEYLNFVNNPDEEMWPSAPDPKFSFSAESICEAEQPKVAFISNAGVPSNFMVQIDVNADGYKPNTADVLIEKTFEAGTNKLVWDGKDAYGNIVPSGTRLDYTYKSYTSPMNFPVFDAEGNASGFKSENVRPVPSTVNDLLYWDDSNLPSSKFPLATQRELNGVNANTGAHLWGASADDGNGYTLNTWTYGYTFTKNESLVFTYECNMGVLPVTIASFKVKPDYEGVRLDWSTAMELNNKFFVVERSSDGKVFEEIGQIAGKGTTHSKISYSYLDSEAPAGVVYYRLKQVDTDYSFSYSNVKMVYVAAKDPRAKAVAYPNPVSSDLLKLDLSMLPNGVYELNVHDASGRKVKQTSTVDGGKIHLLDTSRLPAGFLFLELIGTESKQTLQILKKQ